MIPWIHNGAMILLKGNEALKLSIYKGQKVQYLILFEWILATKVIEWMNVRYVWKWIDVFYLIFILLSNTLIHHQALACWCLSVLL